MERRAGIETSYYAIPEQSYNAGAFFVRTNQHGVEITVNTDKKAKRAWTRAARREKREMDYLARRDAPTWLERTAENFRAKGNLPARLLGGVASFASLFDARVARRDAERLRAAMDGEHQTAALQTRQQRELRLSIAEGVTRKVADYSRSVVISHTLPELAPDATSVVYDGGSVSAEDLNWCMRRIARPGSDMDYPVTPADMVGAMFAEVADEPKRLEMRIEAMHGHLAGLSFAQECQAKGMPGAGIEMMQSIAGLVEVYADEQDVQAAAQRANNLHAVGHLG